MSPLIRLDPHWQQNFAMRTGYLWPHSWQNLGIPMDDDALSALPMPAGDAELDGDDSGGKEESDEDPLDTRIWASFSLEKTSQV